jgi:hypothetical protein
VQPPRFVVALAVFVEDGLANYPDLRDGGAVNRLAALRALAEIKLSSSVPGATTWAWVQRIPEIRECRDDQISGCQDVARNIRPHESWEPSPQQQP